MRVITVRNTTRNVEIGQNIRVATTLLERTVGLLATSTLANGDGMYLSPCRSIHTFFMRFPIDVLFIDSHGKVLSQKTYFPWKFSGVSLGAQGVLELPAGTLARTRTQVGDQIEMRGNS